MSRKKIEAVIFEWAGTTVDYGCFAPVEAFTEVFRHYGIVPTQSEVREPMGMLKIDHIKTMLKMERIKKLWKKKYGETPKDADAQMLYEMFEPKLLGILDQFCEPKPYVIETVEELRQRGYKIGSTTGYTDKMMEIVTREAARKGYEPDCWFSPDSTGGMGRPYPFMIFHNMEALKISNVSAVVKVGDTISDIKEGKNAGLISIGVLEGSSLLGLSEEEYNELNQGEKEAIKVKATIQYKEAGADYVIDTMKDLPNILEEIEKTEF